MPREKDTEIDKILSDAIANHEASVIKYEARRLKELWRQVELPISLKECLLGLTKDELDTIRRNLNLKNISALNKNQLAEYLAGYQAQNLVNTLSLLDKGRLQLLQLIARSGGYIVYDGYDFDVSCFTKYCLAFSGTMDGQRVVFMPNELLQAFKVADNRELAKTAARNTDWISMSFGALHYYGIMEPWVLADKINHLTKETVDYKQYYSVIAMASDFYQQIRLNGYGIMDERVDDPKELKAAIMNHYELDYYPFSKQQLMDASSSDFFERTPAMRDLSKFLITNYGFTKDEANHILLEISDMIMIKYSTHDIIELLKNFIEIPDLQFTQILAALVTAVINQTRIWELKGHSPYELNPEKHQYRELKSRQANAANVYSIRTGAKIGRNDPCPCGSGKKYKKCCGK